FARRLRDRQALLVEVLLLAEGLALIRVPGEHGLDVVLEAAVEQRLVGQLRELAALLRELGRARGILGGAVAALREQREPRVELGLDVADQVPRVLAERLLEPGVLARGVERVVEVRTGGLAERIG